MTSDRAYRPGLPQGVVLVEMQKMAGRLLDAGAVEACRRFVLDGQSAVTEASIAGLGS